MLKQLYPYGQVASMNNFALKGERDEFAVCH